MIDVGKLRAEQDKFLQLERLNWVCANAEDLPFEDNSFDAYTIAFGIRNCTHVDKVINLKKFIFLGINGSFSRS